MTALKVPKKKNSQTLGKRMTINSKNCCYRRRRKIVKTLKNSTKNLLKSNKHNSTLPTKQREKPVYIIYKHTLSTGLFEGSPCSSSKPFPDIFLSNIFPEITRKLARMGFRQCNPYFPFL